MKIILKNGHIIELVNAAGPFEEQLKEVRERPNSNAFVSFWGSMVRIHDISAIEDCW